MLESPEFRIVQHGTPEYDELVRLRTDVLRTPLGLKFSKEELQLESDQFHIGGYLRGELVGCLTLAPLSAPHTLAVKMRQVAILPAFQKRGMGQGLVKYSEEFAREKGFEEIILNARDTAVPFYLMLGYEIYGEVFEEVTIPHRSMRKRIFPLLKI